MGVVQKATCRDCACEFSVRHGGGFTFEEYYCTKCGHYISIPRSELEEGGYDTRNGGEDQTKVLSQIIIKAMLERGGCKCGGPYTTMPTWRCPQCQSTNIQINSPTIFYD